jgi:uncharacterized membrane-anchored protein
MSNWQAQDCAVRALKLCAYAIGHMAQGDMDAAKHYADLAKLWADEAVWVPPDRVTHDR